MASSANVRVFLKLTNVTNGFNQRRCISQSCALYGKRNFRKFTMPNKRGTKEYKAKLSELDLVDHRGVRMTGSKHEMAFKQYPEMIPELIVPDLTNCELKPYISYQAPDVTQGEFTARDLFNVIYSKKIIDDYEAGKLDNAGNPLAPSEEEKMTAEEAKIKARMTGSDIFSDDDETLVSSEH
ncbi:39S ribosomal protein L41, mitochondrial-like [Limulus polyphemus]|uniref:39S ribosomal protein L41, mitochondrial-like n=1 Tax=Limulus polyphemus TaxID=6850 RepID=A0ABM1BPG8_LIMPO|nr:39S ribosomal protein L41, mitochondrial-like [Limulus polyphemus]